MEGVTAANGKQRGMAGNCKWGRKMTLRRSQWPMHETQCTTQPGDLRRAIPPHRLQVHMRPTQQRGEEDRTQKEGWGFQRCAGGRMGGS